MPISSAERETILKAIEAWPLEDQIAMAQMILQRAADNASVPQRPTWRELAGLASNGQTPPSDEEIDRWLDQHKLEKYG